MRNSWNHESCHNASSPSGKFVKHQVAVYWKGGDPSVEDYIFSADYIDKAVAWGGHKSIASFLSRAPVGVDILTFDPKLSISMIGKEAFICPQTLQRAAELAVADTLAFNQQACVASRIHYVEGSRANAEFYASMCYEILMQQNLVLEQLQFSLVQREVKNQLNLVSCLC